jgi:hypothetical protein
VFLLSSFTFLLCCKHAATGYQRFPKAYRSFIPDLVTLSIQVNYTLFTSSPPMDAMLQYALYARNAKLILMPHYPYRHHSIPSTTKTISRTSQELSNDSRQRKLTTCSLRQNLGNGMSNSSSRFLNLLLRETCRDADF